MIRSTWYRRSGLWSGRAAHSTPGHRSSLGGCCTINVDGGLLSVPSVNFCCFVLRTLAVACARERALRGGAPHTWLFLKQCCSIGEYRDSRQPKTRTVSARRTELTARKAGYLFQFYPDRMLRTLPGKVISRPSFISESGRAENSNQ